jgi:hypothetical protein
MAQFVKVSGANLTTPSNFDIFFTTRNIAHITSTAVQVVLTCFSGSTATDVITITIPSDTTGTFQRQIIDLIMNTASWKSDGGFEFVDAPPTFTNGENAANNKITNVAIA